MVRALSDSRRVPVSLLLLMAGCLQANEQVDTASDAGPVAVAARLSVIASPPVPGFPICDTAACCPSNAQIVALTDASNAVNNTTASRCIVALGGSDNISSNAANVVVLAGAGDDVIIAGPASKIRGGAGNDTINGFGGATIFGGDATTR